ncbi:MAG TPA: winged helix-turn-helix transcriptional regulator [Candidatus Thermoplasmatota archaeon]|nr:winged helix-turn-helix transcriptional regulator [Candidatus Thermoplasmatota archaeon]
MPVATAAELQLSFRTPAQAGPRAAVDGAEWLWLELNGPRQARFSFDMPGATYTNYTYASVNPRLLDDSGMPISPQLPDRQQPGPVGMVTLDFSGRIRSSLFVKADRIELSIANATLDLNPLRAGSDTATALQDRGSYSDTHRRGYWMAPSDGAAISVQGDTRPRASFVVRAQGLRVVEWHNATVTCQDDGHCPDGAGTTWKVAKAPTGDGATVTQVSFAILNGNGGNLDGAGEAQRAATGGPALDVGVQGTLRLPLADRTAPCQCIDPAGKTIILGGNLTLHHLSMASDSRLEADVSGSAVEARLDELRVNPALVFGAKGAVVAGGVAVGIAALVAWLLFSRVLHPERALRNPKRRGILEAVVAHPGLEISDLSQSTGYAEGTVRHHLAVLQRVGLVVANRTGRRVHFFENHGRYAHNWRTVAAQRDSKSRQLLEWIHRNPGRSQGEVVEEGEAFGMKRSAVLRRLGRLAAAGLVTIERKGRTRLYYLAARPQE